MQLAFGGDTQQRLRIASGLTLMVFASTHFLNHALGLYSLELMHRVQEVRTYLTRSIPGTIVLAAALFTHMGLGLYKLSRRSTLRMPLWEAAQIAVGLAIPFLLLPHIVNTRVARVAFGVDDIYLYELVRLWPDSAVLQSTLLLLVWLHGCLGIHYWLRLTDGYQRAAPWLALIAVAVPVLALGGFVTAALTTADVMSDPATFAAFKARTHWPSAAANADLGFYRDCVRYAAAAAVAAALTAVYVRSRKPKESTGVAVSYLDGPTVMARPGMTLLEASRMAGVPHASLCGGRARCTTCRVKVTDGLETLPRPNNAERIALASIEAMPDVRLACQVRPTAPATVSILNKPGVTRSTQVEFVEVKELVGAHVRAALAGEIADFASNDPAAVKAWLAARVQHDFPVCDLAPAGFRLIGGRLDYVRDRPGAVLVYSRGNTPVSLFVLADDQGVSLATRATRNGVNVLGWNDGSIACFAVSSLPQEGLDELEEGLNDVLAERG